MSGGSTVPSKSPANTTRSHNVIEELLEIVDRFQLKFGPKPSKAGRHKTRKTIVDSDSPIYSAHFDYHIR